VALDLTMKIVADASQAKRELASVEQGINRVEQAAKKGEPSIASVAKELGVYDNVTNKVVQSTAKLEETTKKLSTSTADQLYHQVRLSSGLADTEQAANKLSVQFDALKASTAAAGASTVVLAGALAAFLAVGALELKFLYDSARLYAEKTGMLKQFEGAVDSVRVSWENMQFAVGATLLANAHDVTSWASLVKMAIDEVGVYITHMVIQAQAAIGMLGSAMRWIPGVGGGLPTPPGAPTVSAPSRSFSTGQITGQFHGNESAASIEAELNAQRAVLDRASGRRAVAPYVIPTAGGGYNIGGLPGGTAFGLPLPKPDASPYLIPSLTYGYGISGPIGQPFPKPQAPATPSPGFFGSVFGGNFGSNLSSVIMQAVTGGGSFLQGAGSLIGSGIGSFAQKGLGLVSGLGGALGSLLPGVGALLGPAIGMIGKLFGETQGHKDLIAANTQIGGIKTDLLSQFGSKENIGLLGGQDVLAGWGSQNVKGLQAFSTAVDAFKAKSVNAMNEMIHNAMTAGTAIPASMRPILESLIRQGQLTEANANLLMGLPEKGVPSFQQVSQAAAELGVNLDAIGKNIQNLKLAERAEAAAAAFQTLADAGANMGAVFEQSAPKIQEMVTDALKLGLTLPESIKPWLQQMVDAGLLLDETGAKLTDLSRFSFTKPLEKSVEDLIAKLDDLIDTIKTGLGGALDEIDGKNVSVTVHRKVVDDENTSDPNTPEYATGTRGYEYFGSGKLVRLHGWEKVTPLTSSASASAGGGGLTIHVNNPSVRDDRDLDTLVDRIVQVIPRRMALNGL